MIFVTGDTHGRHDFLKLLLFSDANKTLTKDDYLIIAGDFGGIFNPKTVEEDLDIYSALPFTVLFVDGNHENFDLLNAYPESEMFGGKVHVVRPDIIHLMRGQVYDIDGKRIFTFGGATSIDRDWRRGQGIDWWEQEVPTPEDLAEGYTNLKKVGNKVDYIITHSCDERALYYPPLSRRLAKREIFPENQLLTNIEETVSYRHWYFGHYHVDGDLTPKKTALYQAVLPLE